LVESPFVRQAFQGVCSGVGEAKAGTRNKIFHRLRDEHAAGGRQGRNPRRNVQGNSVQLTLANLTLAGMKSNAAIDSERAQGLHNRYGAFDGASRAVKCREKPIPRRVDFLAAMSRQLGADCGMMYFQKVRKAQIALGDSYLRRPDNVCEHQGRYPTFGYRRGGAARQEALNVVHEFI
jgi:hypothetical protein